MILSPLIITDLTIKRDVSQLTPEDLDEEADRLEMDYNRNWMKYEGFSLQEAFRSQAARVEVEWENHENQLAEEFRLRKQRITGNSTNPSDSQSNSNNTNSTDPRWHSPGIYYSLLCIYSY